VHLIVENTEIPVEIERQSKFSIILALLISMLTCQGHMWSFHLICSVICNIGGDMVKIDFSVMSALICIFYMSRTHAVTSRLVL
jgi:hypothetical protein